MKQIIILKECNENQKSSVYGNYDYGCKYAIVASDESMVKKRGFHMTDGEIRDLLHNIPKEFKDAVRVLKPDSEIKHYDPVGDAKRLADEKAAKEAIEAAKLAMQAEIDKAKEAQDAIDKELAEKEEKVEPVADFIIVPASEEGKEKVDLKVVEAIVLTEVDYSKFNENELNEYRNKLKVYAKENGIKVHPALKNIDKIIEKIKG